MFDVTSLGEILIDFTPSGLSENGNLLFERNPGGAPANLAVSIARLGGSSAFIGKAGDDMFGRFLKKTLGEEHVDIAGLILTKESRTTLAFVELGKKGERDFSFYRDRSADTLLKSSEIRFDYISNSRFFHFGSLSLTHSSARNATMAAIGAALKSGVNISYDPNLRPALWKNPDEARKNIMSVMKNASVVKVSDEELFFITGDRNIDTGAGIIIKKFDTPILLVTRGAEGANSYFCGKVIRQSAYTGIKAIDTTGAGDAFLGAFLHSLLHEACMDVRHPFSDGMELCLRFASAAAAICVSRKGAIPALPTRSEVMTLLENS
jgi:fructokinase